MTTEFLERVERALTHALEGKLGKLLKPLYHQGDDDPADVEAVAALMELRRKIKGGSRGGQ